MTARPTAPPTWRVVLMSPAARPACVCGTPDVADMVIGTKERPKPVPARTKGPKMCAQ